MARPLTPVGTYGRIGFVKLSNGSVRARAFFRDLDGVTRPVTRFGRSKAAAERRLRESLRDRMGPSGDQITADTRVRVVVGIWEDEISTSDLSEQSKESYLGTLDRHVLPALGELLVREASVSRIDAFLKAVRANSGPGAA